MTSTAFEAALGQPDDDASNFQLCTLISARDFSGPTLPAVAESYLRVFCEITPSAIRRRWVGIALAGMMGQSPSVVAHIRQMGQELQKLGAIILSNGEQEETKVIAGIIIRQGLEHGIEYGSFWDSDRFRNSAPIFPEKHDARWMSGFQGFLDTLGELALTNPTTDASILFPISLVTSDNFRWRDSSSGLPVALIQSGHMTIIAPNAHLEEIQFVDIPVSHIQSVRSEPARLHDSQAQGTNYKPWDVVLTLRTEPWSYRLNSVQRTATGISLLFAHEGDAQEWMGCVKAHQKALKVHPMMSRSSPIASTSSSDQNLNTRKPTSRESQSQRASQPTIEVLLVESSDPVIQRPRSYPPHVEKQTLPGQAPPKTLPSSKRATYSKGKLPRISQETKQKALKQLHAPSDDLDLPMEEEETGQAQLPDASSSAISSSERSQPSRETIGHGLVKIKKTRKSQSKHKGDDDEDFVPNGPKPKKTNGKRKSAPDVVTNTKPAKKARMRPVNNAKATTTRSKQQSKPKLIAQPPSSIASSHHSLIGGLLGSQKPSQTSGVSFKKPDLPAINAETPSTPTKPRKRTVEVPARPETPQDGRRYADDEALPPIASSPPSHYVAGNRSNRLRRSAIETEVLSSNSKPVPASPNAESTAISGHADCDDVASEKRTGDFQTAKSDPFSQRTKSGTVTELYRRLTVEKPANATTESTTGFSHSVPPKVNRAETSKAEAVAVASQPNPQPMPWQKRSIPSENIVVHPHSGSEAANTRRSAVGVKAGSRQITDSSSQVREPKQDANERDAQKSKRKATPTAQQNGHETSANIDCDPPQQASTELTPPQTTRLREELEELHDEQTARPSQSRPGCSQTGAGVDKGDSILDFPKQVVDNTQMEYPDQGEDMDMEGDTLPAGYGDDEQSAMDPKASPVNFRSSPPLGGSPSSHSSTSAEPEPRTDPPLPSSQAEEMEWEASLQPHQRALHDLLLRTSKRVMRHIVDNETGVTDIAETFARDGEHVLNSLLQRYDGDYDDVFQGMEGKKKDLQRELERAVKQMADERRGINALV
jgi:hypothetical protein